MRLLITGGGTGGHLVIAKALKEEALRHDIELFYLGSTYGQDQAWFTQDSDFKKRLFYTTTGVVNKRGFRKLLALWATFKAMIKALAFIRTEKIDAVISVGGYSAAPASFAAVISRKPLYIHEQNAAMGRLNRLLRPYAKRFFSSYFEPKTDYPVSDGFFKTKRLRSTVKNVLFLGGSQGAKAINSLAVSLAPWLHEKGITITLQCGKAHEEAMKEAFNSLNIPVTLFAFSKEMPNVLTQADFAIARAGASSVWEVTANMLPTLFIPYPFAAIDHQTSNALAHVDQKAAWMMQEDSLDLEQIKSIIKQDMSDVSERLSTLLKEHGAEFIISSIQKDLSC